MKRGEGGEGILFGLEGHYTCYTPKIIRAPFYTLEDIS